VPPLLATRPEVPTGFKSSSPALARRAYAGKPPRIFSNPERVESAAAANRFNPFSKVWPGARTGAKGQQPPHGRAGAGLASPAGIGAGANVIISRRDYINQPGVDAERLRRVAIAN